MAERKTQETKPQEEQKITVSVSELQEMIRAEVAKAKEAEPAQAQELTRGRGHGVDGRLPRRIQARPVQAPLPAPVAPQREDHVKM